MENPPPVTDRSRLRESGAMDRGLTRLTFRELLVFCTICEQRNITRSAEVLGSTQPSLSRTIKELEATIGRPLFVRSTRSIEPTTAGLEFYAWAVRFLDGLETAVGATRDVADGRSGFLTIGYMDFAIVGQLPEMLRHFRTQNPTVHLDLRGMATQEQVFLLQQGEIDVGFISGSPLHGSLSQRELYSERLVAVFPDQHPLASQPTLNLGQLARETFITGGHKWRFFTDLVEGLCAERGFMPKVAQIAPNRDGILGLVLAGAGIAVYPECICNAPRSGLSFVPIGDTGSPVKISVIWNTSSKNPLLPRFLDHILGAEDGYGPAAQAIDHPRCADDDHA